METKIKICGLSCYCNTYIIYITDKLLFADCNIESREAFQLIYRSAGMPESSPAHFGNFQPACCNHWAKNQ